MIEIRQLTKRFGRTRALDGLSLSARNGEITGLIGPNGAGKTTTFRILYGLLRPDSGEATIDGLDVTRERTAVLRRLGVLPETRGLYPRLNVREHLRYFGRLQGLAGAALEQRLDQLVEQLGLEELIDRRVRGFSRGQELKVALGRALIHQPGTLILDEPTNGLDVPANRAVRQILRQMRDAGHCIVLSSHVMAEVAALCDRLVIVRHGRAVVTGTLDDLRQRFATGDLEEVYLRALAEPAEITAVEEGTP